MWLAMIFDFLDGFTARILKVHSEIGKELDSLADMVTFGVLPSVMVYHLLLPVSSYFLIPFAAYLIAVFSALRLAKFNIDERQTTTFIGLPTPANALFISSLYFVFQQFTMLNNEFFIVGIIIIFSFLLVSPLELFSLKFKSFGWRDNVVRYIFLLMSITSLLFLKTIAIPLIIIIYLALSMSNKLFKFS